MGALTWFPESRKDRDRYLVDYDRLNEGVIGRVVDECDPTRTFWPSSPSAGRGDYSDNWHNDARGDMHYWSVWHEGKPFSSYYTVKPRFCSEFGYQSFPSLSTIRTYAGEEDLNVTSPVMEHHQRHRGGNSIINEMFARYFRIPDGLRELRLPQPGAAGAGDQDGRGVLETPAAALHGHAVLAVERQLAGLLVVFRGVRRLMEAAALCGEVGFSRPPFLPRS